MNEVYLSLYGSGPPKVSIRDDLHDTDFEKASTAVFKNGLGEVLPRDAFPTMIYQVPTETILKFPQKGPSQFCNGYIYISEAVKNVMVRHDLGRAQFFPVKLFEEDKKTPIEQRYYALNFCNIKDAIDFEKSDGKGLQKAMINPKSDERWIYEWVNDGEVFVSKNVLKGPKIWLEPKKGKGVFFASGDLVKDLKKSRLDKDFTFRKCKVVD